MYDQCTDWRTCGPPAATLSSLIHPALRGQAGVDLCAELTLTAISVPPPPAACKPLPILFTSSPPSLPHLRVGPAVDGCPCVDGRHGPGCEGQAPHVRAQQHDGGAAGDGRGKRPGAGGHMLAHRWQLLRQSATSWGLQAEAVMRLGNGSMKLHTQVTSANVVCAGNLSPSL